MKTFLITLFCFICIAKSYGQNSEYGEIEVDIEKSKRTVLCKVENRSALHRGDSAWVQSIESKLKENILANKQIKRGRYNVVVELLVERDGSIGEFRSRYRVGVELINEIKRLILKSSYNKWSPSVEIKKDIARDSVNKQWCFICFTTT